MKKFVIRMRNLLFERIKILANDYGISINQMMIELLETGLDQKKKEEERYEIATHKHN
jgi:predicted HicB family RNase H-like nuclease